MALGDAYKRKIDPSFYEGSSAPWTGYTTPYDPNPVAPTLSSADDMSPARSRTGGASAVSPGAGVNPAGAYAPTTPSLGNPSPYARTAQPEPTGGQPSLTGVQPQPNLIRDYYGPELQSTYQQLQSAYAAPRPGMARQVLGALLSRRAPQLAGLISGETQRQRAIEPLAMQAQTIQSQIAAQRAYENQQVENDLKRAQTGYALAHANVIENPVPKPTPEEQSFAGYKTQINPETNKLYTDSEAYKQVQQDKQDVKPEKPIKAGLDYDPGTGIPISYNDEKGVKWDVNDPNLPDAAKPLVKNALNAHAQHVKEQADAQARGIAAVSARQEKTFTRADVKEHDKNYVQPAESVEKSYQMMNQAYNEYKQAKAQGKELPTGAQSMLALSTHLATTFGNVKGSRVTKDMIQEHLGARGISDKALVAIQSLTNGDRLSPDQWDAFHDLISQSRKESWQTAVKQANRKDIPVDFLPKDLTGISGDQSDISKTPATHRFNPATGKIEAK